jgi:hypothetical protein
MTATATLAPAPVNVRITISALWTTMLFVFAYVDLFSLYRPDIRAAIEAGEVSGFTIGEAFLLGATVYVLIPSLMVVGALVLRPRAARITSLVLSAAYALTILVGAIGEWGYYVLGSAVEVALLAAIAHRAWTWPRDTAPASVGRDATSPTAVRAPVPGDTRMTPLG